ncbi:alpha/beta hydrolase [Lysobacter sp. LF1]|uniref:Alpha/beta hydrolase n=1 Tax=Lysobacter stagni TaxID=3045172 RepID=A0ABT6XJ24_9GAMM|nr:alpha/beta hydrolase [Lysobacter sp. LF1]MDI9240162.1 alpha/beta hydrolase [Lysobacter sp. LF1]
MKLPALLLATTVAAASVTGTAAAQPAETGFVRIDDDITLRRLVVRNAQAKGAVLFLHGFPETILSFKDIAISLGDDFEVHTFDWPGYGESSRPAPDRFAYAPTDYARVLKAYIEHERLDTSKLTIYATDIGALPALLLALDEPGIARRIIVGDFAPFDRPQYMYESLRNLKTPAAAEPTRAAMNATSAEILANVHRRDLPPELQYDLPPELAADMARNWNRDGMTTADAFFHYYGHFTRDQQFFEANVERLGTPVRVIWGERDLYIRPDMGVEFAKKAGVEIDVLPGIGHFPHLQDPQRTVREVRASMR